MNLIEEMSSRFHKSFQLYIGSEVGINPHEIIKCELYGLAFDLGYLPFPEFTVMAPRKGTERAYVRFDMVWFKDGVPRFVFEIRALNMGIHNAKIGIANLNDKYQTSVQFIHLEVFRPPIPSIEIETTNYTEASVPVETQPLSDATQQTQPKEV